MADKATMLVAEIRGACNPEIIAGVNGNLPPGWHASNLSAYRQGSDSSMVSVFCTAERLSARGNAVTRTADVGAKLEIDATSKDADKLRIADALAEQLRERIAAKEPRTPPRAALMLDGISEIDGQAGCYTLKSLQACQVQPGSCRAIATGVRIALPHGVDAQVWPMVGQLDSGLLVASDHYFGPVSDMTLHVHVYTAGKESVTIAKGQPVARLVFSNVSRPDVDLTWPVKQ